MEYIKSDQIIKKTDHSIFQEALASGFSPKEGGLISIIRKKLNDPNLSTQKKQEYAQTLIRKLNRTDIWSGEEDYREVLEKLDKYIAANENLNLYNKTLAKGFNEQEILLITIIRKELNNPKLSNEKKQEYAQTLVGIIYKINNLKNDWDYVQVLENLDKYMNSDEDY